jgi:methyl-accepting chemotaxis protein
MSWYRNLSVQLKLAAGFMVVVVATAGLGWFSLVKMDRMDAASSDLAVNWLPSIEYLAQMRFNFERMRADELKALLSVTDAERAEHIEQAIALGKVVPQIMAKYEPTILADGEKATYPVFKKDWLESQQLSRQIFENLRARRFKEAQDVSRQSGHLFNAMRGSIDQLLDINIKAADVSYHDAKDTHATARNATIALVIGIVLLSIFIGFFTARGLSKPMAQLVEVLGRLAAGDLTVRLGLGRRDEIGLMSQALDRSMDSMQTTLSNVQAVADEVAAASQQLASAATEISTGAQEQASSLEETAANLEEITSTVKQNADNAQQANQLAAGSREIAEKGGSVVHGAMQAMEEINTSSRKVADIITTIDEIAFQTNLLALNAAVEAARAGEQGRGFAVVATEVRNLAQRSAGAAKEIKGLIQDSAGKVEHGARQVSESGQTLEAIVASVKRVTDIVGEIAAASREQTTGIEQVNQAVTNMDSVTQANASQTEELSATAETLSDRAGQLLKLVGRFQLGDGAMQHKAPAAAPVAPPAAAASTKKRSIDLKAKSTAPPANDNAHARQPARKVANGDMSSFEEF